MRDDFAGVFGQKSEGHPLDDAGEGQLNINDHFVKLAAAGGRGFHEPSGSVSETGMSMSYRNDPKRTPPSEFRGNLTREAAGKTESRQRPSKARNLVTGPASENFAQATSGCRQHHFCCILQRAGSVAGFFSTRSSL